MGQVFGRGFDSRQVHLRQAAAAYISTVLISTIEMQHRQHGNIAQLGERSPDWREVMGSSPVVSIGEPEHPVFQII